MKSKVLTILVAVAVSLGIAGTASASVGPQSAAQLCTLTASYPLGPVNGLAWSETYEYWYTQGLLHAGDCGAVWVIHFGINHGGQFAQSARYRLRTYNADESIHDTFPWTDCHGVGDRFDVRDTAPGDITPGRRFRVYARACNPFYNLPGYRPGFQINAGLRA